ncbi:D-2-hydroxyacid dehydrogenase [Halomonas sp. E14]|uniref:D-2-hydroxyacid dehydrogenase n=1 Tax=Halomonas sp. E14 TaxID=3397245 RepID=UPI00403E52BD
MALDSLERILFLQKEEVLQDQRELVLQRLGEWYPAATIDFAGSAQEVYASRSYDAVITPTLPWLAAALNKLERFCWIHFLSAGVEKIWEMDFDKANAFLTKSSGVHGAPMSEYAIGAMLYFAKQFNRFHEQSKRAEWKRTWLNELTGRRVTILGLGHVGTALAQRAKAFDMEVVGTLRHIREVPNVDRVVAMEDIGQELSRSDYLVVCLPLTPETRGLVDAAFLSRLKPGAVLVDISRGGVVNGDAVLNALDSGILKGAALDVFEWQPLPEGSPLWKHENVLVTPHVSGTTPFYLERALEVFHANALALLSGREPVTPVNREAGY